MMSIAARRRLLGFGLVALIALVAPLTASAQATDRAEAVTVSLWPDFDAPEVLVIIRVSLPADTTFPATLRIPIPAEAPPLTAVAYRDPTGGLVNAAYERQEGEAADLVVVQAQASELQLEYYDPLTQDGASRSYTYTWPGGLEATAFSFEVQQPVTAEGFAVSPPAGSRTTDSLGLTYHRTEVGPLAAGDTPTVSVSYRNPSGQLSADTIPPAGPLATPAPSGSGGVLPTSLLPWLLLVAGVVMIAGGLIYYFRFVRSSDRPSRQRHRPSRRPDAERMEVDASPVFCHNCGTQASSSDRFCRTCGTALRT
jgi:hypothetical protein